MGPQEASPKSGPSGIQKSDTFELPVKALAIGDFVIIKDSVTWIDHINGFRKSGTGIDFRLKDVSLDQPFPLDTADPKALNRLSLVARLKADQKSVVVTDGKLRLDDSTVNMKLKIVNFDKPDLTFDLTLDKIDADRYLPHFVIAVARADRDRRWVIRATIDSHIFNSLVKTVRIGKTGEAYLLDAQGVFQTERRSGGSLPRRYCNLDARLNRYAGTSTCVR